MFSSPLADEQTSTSRVNISANGGERNVVTVVRLRFPYQPEVCLPGLRHNIMCVDGTNM